MSATKLQAPTSSATNSSTASNRYNIELFSTKYFLAAAAGGVFACGPTHTAITPLDLAKCIGQTSKSIPSSPITTLRMIYQGSEPTVKMGLRTGLPGVVTGWSATFVGYSIQGAGKYGLYEYFQYKYKNLAPAHFNQDLINGAASATAEFIADIGLCPLEAVKVRLQTNPSYAQGLVHGFSKMMSEGGFSSFYSGLGPLWARQIPYTVTKFVAFERIVDELFNLSSTPRDQMSQAQTLGIVFSAGYLAGILCAVVSHPADVMVSKINNTRTSGSIGSKISSIYSEIGFKGLWNGLGTRVVMLGTLTGMQWFLYGTFKQFLGLPAPGK